MEANLWWFQKHRWDRRHPLRWCPNIFWNYVPVGTISTSGASPRYHSSSFWCTRTSSWRTLLDAVEEEQLESDMTPSPTTPPQSEPPVPTLAQAQQQRGRVAALRRSPDQLGGHPQTFFNTTTWTFCDFEGFLVGRGENPPKRKYLHGQEALC